MSWFDKYKNPNLPLIIADLANNHSGSVQLGKEMIVQLAELKNKYKFPIAVKFQYRNLDTFIASKYKGTTENAYIPRFEKTKLSWDEFAELTEFAKNMNLLTSATPFDEFSAIKVVEHQHDFIKIASASSTDWSLLDNAVKLDLPFVVSTGGLTWAETSKVAARLLHTNRDFTLMHCVALYPTEDPKLNINRVREIKNKYNCNVGYSTHENPDNFTAASLAVSSGAIVLERHFGKETEEIKLNSYSSDQDKFGVWLERIMETYVQLFDKDEDKSIVDQKVTLRKLQRGAYLSKSTGRNTAVKPENIYFAFPVEVDQISANEISFHSQIQAIDEALVDAPLTSKNVKIESVWNSIDEILGVTKEIILQAHVNLPKDVIVDISHHYGLARFKEFGAVLVTVLNRDYCKKILVLLPGQKHPAHFHKIKEESFIVLNGDLELTLDGVTNYLNVGDVATVNVGVQHELFSKNGCVVEEISTKYLEDDSFYLDEDINLNLNRKTKASFWS
jgi:sialic acid synthase SpsE/mannose-6-phosphate isomerase-like protein (cupin superfamily)